MFRRDSRLARCAALALLSVICLATRADAQGRQQQQAGQPEPQNFRIEGKITGIRPGYIQWTADGQTPCVLKLDPKQTRRVTVTGSATPEVLQPGMFVRFTATLDKKANVTEPVQVLTIFTPSQEPDQGFTIGIYSEDPNNTDGPYTVAGELRSFRRGKFTLAAGNQPVTFELAEAPEIGVDVNDYRIASVGDEISGNAMGYDLTQLIASAIDIKMAQPLSAPQKKGRNQPKRKPADDDVSGRN